MIILDTHAWIWWISESSKLSATALQTILQATEPIGSKRRPSGAFLATVDGSVPERREWHRELL